MLGRNNGPVRLERAEPTTSLFEKDLVIRISFTALLILAMMIFVGLCFLIKGPTYGYV